MGPIGKNLLMSPAAEASPAMTCDVGQCAFRRRRPFLIRPLENTLVKLILSLEFYSQEGRQKIAVGARR